MAASSHDENHSKSKGVLDDFSLSQVIASTLSAVTSLLLSSKIGIIGGVLGAAVGAAVAAIATQLYKGMIRASTERVQSMMENVAHSRKEDEPSQDTALEAQELASDEEAASDDTKQIDAATELTSQDTEVMPQISSSEDTDGTNEEGTTKRRGKLHFVMALIILAALVAVGITAYLIDTATSGEGLGAKPSITSTQSTSSQTQTSTNNAMSTTAPETASAEDSTSDASTSAATDVSDSTSTSATTDTTTDATDDTSNPSTGDETDSSESTTTDTASSPVSPDTTTTETTQQ